MVFFVEKDINDVLAIDFHWNSKKEKTIWRGRTTGSTVELSRKVVVDIGKQRPDILDAGFVNFVQGAEKRPEFVKDSVKLIPFMRPVEMTAYKFILIVDGNASSYALYWALSSGSLVLLYSTYKMWFSQYFSELCVVVDKTNLISTIERVKQENFKSKFIADMAREESKKLFNSKAVAKYFKLVLQKVEIDQLISVRLS